MTKTKELKLYGIALFILGFIDIGYGILNIREVAPLLVNESTAVAVLTYAIVSISFLLALAKFWMGRQALCYAKGTGKGTSHITLAKIGIVFCTLGLVIYIISAIRGTASNTDIAGDIASLMVMCSYYKTAKECL